MELVFQVRKSPEFVFHVLTNSVQFVHYHPVITSMNLQADNSYVVHETMKAGIFPISFRYQAIIVPILQNREVLINATIAKFNRIEMRFSLFPEDYGVRVVERVEFFSPLPIAGILQRIFRQQHAIFFANMEKLNLPVS